MITAISAAKLVTGDEVISSPVLLCEDGKIRACGKRSSIDIPGQAIIRDFPDAVVAPGLFDLHIHGAAGYDVMQHDEAGLHRMGTFLASHGVTSFLATTVTAPLEQLESSLEWLADRIERWSPEQQTRVQARPAGIHLEGPCISRLRRGVHPSADIQNPSPELFERLYRAAHGSLRMITVAPELPGALDLIREATRRGITVSVGHSDATAEDVQAAIAAGARHATHTFNAMRPLDHRSPGILGEVLSNEALSADIIADGIHVDPRVVDVFLRAKGKHKAVLISDALSATGMPDGHYRLGSFDVEVRGGRCESEGKLAGSVLTLDQAVRNVMQFAGWNLAESVRLATVNASAVVGSQTTGMFRIGDPADLVVLSPKGDVINSFVAGRPALG